MFRFEIRQTEKGRSIFTLENIKRGDFIVQWQGSIVKGKDLPHPYQDNLDLYTQISNEEFIGPSGDIDDLINHSCDPNCGMRFENNKINLVAIKDIEAGSELNWDYATTMNAQGIKYLDDWEMECKCGSRICRKIVKNFEIVPVEIQNRYRELGIVPDYILKSI